MAVDWLQQILVRGGENTMQCGHAARANSLPRHSKVTRQKKRGVTVNDVVAESY